MGMLVVLPMAMGLAIAAVSAEFNGKLAAKDRQLAAQCTASERALMLAAADSERRV